MKSITNLMEIIDFLNLNIKDPKEDFLVFKFSDIKKFDELPGGFHHKDFFDMSISRKDEGTLIVGENVYNRLNNSINFLSPNQPIRYIPSRINMEEEGIAIIFKASFLNNYQYAYQLQNEFSFFKLHTCPNYQLANKQVDLLYRIFEEIYAEFHRNDHCSMELIKAYLLIILNLCKRKLGSTKHLAKVTRAEEITSLFEEKVWKHCGNYKSVADYASLLNISTAYLSECVKKSTGKTAKDIIIDYQLVKAKSMLHQTELTVNQIALELGFEETTNFTKFFKRETGQTPKKFRTKP